MTPESNQFAIGIKNETLDFIFKAIVERIPITIQT